ncbi:MULTISPECIES: hypothetical protein [Fischerella]|uniref:hypothetical protein n=2 Tax=Hapalosiphonaceae TaxID=1892263 RepID=UPI0012FAAF8C|nr:MULTISPECIES: hypothetical protein [Fischerella]MBD2432859.1 hypothetical protein [Fischerella sp. FACHB-380]
MQLPIDDYQLPGNPCNHILGESPYIYVGECPQFPLLRRQAEIKRQSDETSFTTKHENLSPRVRCVYLQDSQLQKNPTKTA